MQTWYEWLNRTKQMTDDSNNDEITPNHKLPPPIKNDLSGCGNHGCLIAQPIWVGTNGRCRCLDGLPDKQRIKVTRLIFLLRKELKELKA